jgi:L-histidine N-alpha-methyltransferase
VERQLTIDVLVTAADRHAALCDDVRTGLTASPKFLPPVWFYDEAGSLLFDEITRLPEYYLTRAESSILTGQAAEIARVTGADTLVEIGSGTSDKTRLLLDAMAVRGSLTGIVLLDISEEVLREAAGTLSVRYQVDVHAVVDDFRDGLLKLPSQGRRLWAFLGSTIGNFPPDERLSLLAEFRTAMGPDDYLLVGTDLVKSPRRLVVAYDDAEGITAAFNRNVLHVLNRELAADFDPDEFDHRAVWNQDQSWIEMRLRSRTRQLVEVRELALTVELDEGEEILTEISCKFEPDLFRSELVAAGLRPVRSWLDEGGDFLVSLAEPAGSAPLGAL